MRSRVKSSLIQLAHITGLGASVAAWLADPTSTKLAAAVTGETGSGALVFSTSPTLVTPALGTPASVNLINAVGLPVATGISGLGTGVATALGINIGTAGSPVLNGGDLGTPTSGVATNLTGLPLTTGVTGLLPGANGGTGVNNGASTITIGGSLTFSGGFTTTLTVSANTSLTLPTSGTLAVLDSNTFTGVQIVPAGTAAAPGLQTADATAGGLYKYGTAQLGIANDGLQAIRIAHQDVQATKDSVVIELGRSQTFNVGTGEAYPVVMPTANQTMIDNRGGFGIAAFGTIWNYPNGGAVTEWVGAWEGEKIEVTADVAATFSRVAGSRHWLPVAKDDVTFTEAYGFTFTIPASATAPGVYTRASLIHFPQIVGGSIAPTNGINGILCDTGYEAHINTVSGVNLVVKSAAGMAFTAASGTITATASSSLTFNSTASTTTFQYNSLPVFQVSNNAGGAAFLQVFAANTPTLTAAHASTADVTLRVSSKGTSSLELCTAGGGLVQVSILSTASAANSVVMTGAASGANPRVGSSAENLTLGTGAAIATTATAGHILIPTCAGTPTGVPTGVGAGKGALIIDTTNNKLMFYSGGAWRDAGP